MAFKSLSTIFLSTFLVSQVSSTPVSTCQAVGDVLNILKDPKISAAATSFCSSFISIPVQTATSVATIATTPAPVTTATTLTVTVSASTVITTTLGQPLTTPAPTAVKEKRTIKLPPYLAAFASAKVSSACSCLSITPATTTVKATATITGAASTITSTITKSVTSTSTSTSTVLGVAPQCLPSAITSSPVRLFQDDVVGIAGTADEGGSRFKINNIQDCCSACYLDTDSCVAFSYGNFDNSRVSDPIILDTPSNVNTCRIYRDPFQSCANDVGVFRTGGSGPLAGEVNNVGIGPCTPDVSI
ncbi:MAG: hypothetical protein Q9168_005840 [Polycauliona sp. 1 TL-2023]